MTSRIAVGGRGLFGARRTDVVLRRAGGATTLLGARRTAWTIVDGLRTTTLRVGDRKVSCVEHLFAALGALGAYEGLAVDVEGEPPLELPLLDGGAREWCGAVRALDVPAARPPLVVVRDGEVSIGESLYVFRRTDAGVRRVSVRVEFPPHASDAAWDGTAYDFVARIAPARTFVAARDLDLLLARGAAPEVDPSSVLILADEGRVHATGVPFTADEPARHKLLDLIGDLFVHGGPPEGSVHAARPSHAGTHAAIVEALAAGTLAYD